MYVKGQRWQANETRLSTKSIFFYDAINYIVGEFVTMPTVVGKHKACTLSRYYYYYSVERFVGSCTHDL